ncbi:MULTISPECIES: YcjF family protein [Prochlorococcus]|uniref:YcjF family protein n=1 Tax=Prochlorococcus TaxID=1218 RepID=UPI00055EB9CE|nr:MULTISPECIES: GTP-binding protein [Prochlorococcus]
MKRRNKKIIVVIVGLFLVLILSGVIAAILKLINPLSVVLTCFFLGLLFYQKGWFWWKNFVINNIINPYKKGSPKQVPKDRRQAAQKSLESIDRLIERIQSKVEAEALNQRKQLVEEELLRGDLVIVLFGSGSSGKTSLVRSMLNEIVGEVSAEMGTTKKSQVYRMRLKGLSRGIQIIDTPGILESGDIGLDREKDALYKARHADLIIVVVDTDLRELEMKLISSLAKGGKRLLLVLNKCDLRGEEDVKRLLLLLRKRTSNFISPKEVIPATASPQSIPMPGSYPIQPVPEIDLLIKQISRVLHEEGEELIANNILLQCKNLGDSGRQLLNLQRKKVAIECVDRYAWISSGVVVINPLPGVDLIGAAAVNGQMVMEISRIFGVELTKMRAQELALSVGRTLAGLGIVKGGVSLISNSLNLSLPTLLISRAIQSITAAWLTKVAGESFITYFGQDQDWGDGGIQEVVQKHYDLNSKDLNLRIFIETALKRVVEPLKKKERKELPPYRMPQGEEEP